MTRILALLALLLLVFPAFAQDETPEEERSWLVRTVEDQLSSPNRQIRLSNIQGVLSSDATIGAITIADREGVWLRIVNARIDWTRRALLLGRLEISTLAAERIEVLRQPLPEEGLPAPEAAPFQLPELPLSITLDQLDVPRVVFGPTVFGLASEVSVNGRIRLAGGALETALQVTRLDGPGGQLALNANFSNETRILGLDFRLSEPENGILANLLELEGRPPVGLVLAGEGALDQLDVSLTLDAAEQRILTGRLGLRRQAQGLGFTTSLDGPIANLVPERFRAFFGETTRLEASGLSKDSGGFRLDQLDLESAALRVSAQAETASDGFLQRLTLDASIDNQSAGKVLLPIPGDNRIDRAELRVGFGDSAADQWSASLNVSGLAAEQFSAQTVALEFSGLARNLQDAAQRAVTFNVTGGAGGITSPRADIAEALGPEIALDIAGAWDAGQPIRLDRADLAGNGLSLAMAGTIADYVYDGTIRLNARSIAPFSDLAGRDLAGALRLDARGQILPVSGGFDLTLDGSASGLRVGQDAVDALLEGQTRITGGVARGENGLVARELRVANDQLSLDADGRFATGTADFTFDLALEELALLSDQASGRLTATGRANGTNSLIRLNVNAAVPSGRLMGRTLTEAQVAFEGVQLPDLLDGNITGDAFLDGVRVQLASGIAVSESARRLSGLDFSAGGARVTGDLTQELPLGLFSGRVAVEASDISTAAALALTEASGAVNATINLRPVGANQDGDITAQIRNVVFGTTRIGSADIDAEGSDLFRVPGGNGRVTAQNVFAGGVDIARLGAEARQNADTTEFSANAGLRNGTTGEVAGALSRVDAGFRVALNQFTLSQGATAARLLEPASLTIIGDAITVESLALDVSGGRIEAEGRIADTLDLDVALAALPLSIANVVLPDLALGGTLDGTATIGGTRDSPDVNFDLRGQNLTAAVLQQAGLRSLGITANGRSQGDRLTVDAAVTSPEGLNARAAGTVPLGQGDLGLDVTLTAFPLAVLNAVVPGQDLAGSVAGSARVSGTVANPEASFQLTGNGIAAAPLNAAGLAPLTLSANGAFANQTITLQSATVSGPQGLSLAGSGRVPLSGSGLSVNVDGQAPLALANRFLADRGTQLSGTLALSASASGSIQDPNIQGRITSSGAAVVDPETNVRVSGIALAVGISGDTVTIENVSGAIAGGGRISAAGTVSIAPDSNYPANITVGLDNARYADGELVVATVNGNVSVTGPLLVDPLIAGTIDVERAEITVPESFAGGAAALDVRHIDPPAGVAATLSRARANDGTPTPTARPSVARLNIAINAPNQVFVRGRGLDAELGGSIQIVGPVNNVQPVGGLNLIRGRLGILGQRITFDEGTVTLVGDLDPFLNFVARSEGSDITVFITVTGRVSDIQIAFSSQPELPQDEVLARLIFNRGINELSAFQIAQLATAAAELAGGGNNSLLGSLRAGTGLDDLDVVTDSEGNAGVRAGRYIQENIYLGVEAGAGGNTRGTINLDITENLKARGAVGTNDSSLGIFYERDY